MLSLGVDPFATPDFLSPCCPGVNLQGGLGARWRAHAVLVQQHTGTTSAAAELVLLVLTILTGLTALHL
jgi:hypothetical protein